jgi:hypothetical protein
VRKVGSVISTLIVTNHMNGSLHIEYGHR